MPLIALMDCNNFFVSCELTLRPELRGKPVVVCGPNGGCAVAMSNEAKAVGITRGIPMFKVRDIVRQYGVVMLPASHGLYSKISHQVMAKVASMVEDIEIYSVDEAFLHIPFEGEEAHDFCHYVVSEIMEHTGIPVSIGISTTKTLAKVAARFAKKIPGYKGVCLMDTPYKIRRGLELTSIKDVWGLGRRLCKKLTINNINTAADFADLEEEYVGRVYSLPVIRTHKELHGEICFDRNSHHSVHSTVSHTRTFARDIYDKEDLSARIAEYASSVAKTLRRHKRLALAIEVFITTNRYHEQQPQRTAVQKLNLPDATADTLILVSAAAKALDMIWKPGYGYKRAGVTAIKTIEHCRHQMSLFTDTEKEAKRNRLMYTLDRLNSIGANIHTAATQRRPETPEEKRRSDTEWH